MATFLMIQIQSAPYAGTAYLHSAAKVNGHRFVLFLGSNPDAVCAQIDLHKPDLIGFSCMSTFHKQILALARQLKKKFSIPIILGGPHPTLFPEVIQEDCVDLICRGEGGTSAAETDCTT